MPNGPLTIVYPKRDKPDSGEQWGGTFAEAKEYARKAIRTGRADCVMVMGNGKIAYRYPEAGRA